MFQQFFNKNKASLERSLHEALNDRTPEERAIGIIDNGAQEDLKVLVQGDKLKEVFNEAMRMDKDRKSRYRDYDDMEKDPIIASALELVVDDANQYNQETNSTIWVNGSHQYAKDFQEFAEIIDLENKIWGWSYNLAKYGDYFLGVKAILGEGITGVVEHKHPSQMYRVDLDGQLAGFIEEESKEGYSNLGTSNFGGQTYSGASGKAETRNSSDYVHFINNYKPNFESAKIQVERESEKPEEGVIKDDIIVTSAYGSSILENARWIYKLLQLLDTSLALARLARSQLIRVYYINTEGMTPKERKSLVRDVEEKFNHKKAFDIDKDLYKRKYTPGTYNTDLFLPITSDKGDMRLDSIGGDVDIKEIADIDYVKNKLFAALRIPKAFLGFEEAMPGFSGSTSLPKLDIRYGRMVKKVQRSELEGIYRLFQIHLAYKYKTNDIDLSDFPLSMVPVATAEEDARLEALERRLATASQMLSLADETATQGKLNTDYLVEYTFKSILALPNLDVKKLMTLPKDPAVEPPASTDPATTPQERLAAALSLSVDGKKSPGDILKVVEAHLPSSAIEDKQPSRRGIFTGDMKSPPLMESDNDSKYEFKEVVNERSSSDAFDGDYRGQTR